MAYEAFSGKNFSPSLSADAETPEREPAVLACGRAGLFMGKLNLFSDFLQEITARMSVADDMSGLGSARSVR